MSEVRVILPRELDKTLEALMKAGFAGNKAELVRTALVHFLSTLPTQLPKGYDLETAFSPDGRIFQLEYAVEATNKGGTILGINCHERIVLAKEVKKDPFLVLPNPFLNIFKIHKQIGLTYSGILTDGHIVIKEAKQLITEMEKNEKVNITNLAKELVLFMQPFGQRKNYRPFGLAMILGGLDLEERPRLFLLNSGGLAQEYKACTVGVDREKVEKNSKRRILFNYEPRRSSNTRSKSTVNRRKREKGDFNGNNRHQNKNLQTTYKRRKKKYYRKGLSLTQ